MTYAILYALYAHYWDAIEDAIDGDRAECDRRCDAYEAAADYLGLWVEGDHLDVLIAQGQ